MRTPGSKRKDESSEYELSDSDDDYAENEKLLLGNLQRKQSDDESEEEVFALPSEDSEDGNDDNDVDMESDIADPDDELPSAKAWGQNRRSYYNTDYVDEELARKGQQTEAADYEEQEARAIQERLMREIDEGDYMLDVFTQAPTAPKKEEERKEKIHKDLTKLSKRDMLALFEKESPEFRGLVEDFKEKMMDVNDRLSSVLSLIKSGDIPPSPACEFIKTKYHLSLNYCINIAFYLLLKSRRTSVQSHPVIQRLYQYRQLLKQLEPVNEHVMSQVDEVMSIVQSGRKLEPPKKKAKRKKKKPETSLDNPASDVNEAALAADDEGNPPATDADGQQLEETDERRAITYQISKNKGLTPYRKKELRNPRVKHRKKYEKAKIRRKGQVREPRKELQKYGGEISGIKIGISKSIKIK